jgi:NADH-quinone oxidoreductase subunit J
VAIPDTVPIIGASWDDSLFVLFAAIMLGGALLVVVLRDIIRAGLAMMVSFGGLAGLYVVLGAPLIAAAQVLIYIGAISVLVLFAIMLTQTKAAPIRLVFQTQAVPAAIASALLAVLITTATDALARLLFDEYVLAFEVVGVLILAAVIGAVFLARREREEGGSS